MNVAYTLEWAMGWSSRIISQKSGQYPATAFFEEGVRAVKNPHDAPRLYADPTAESRRSPEHLMAFFRYAKGSLANQVQANLPDDDSALRPASATSPDTFPGTLYSHQAIGAAHAKEIQ